jgi:hypothetical protein
VHKSGHPAPAPSQHADWVCAHPPPSGQAGLPGPLVTHSLAHTAFEHSRAPPGQMHTLSLSQSVVFEHVPFPWSPHPASSKAIPIQIDPSCLMALLWLMASAFSKPCTMTQLCDSSSISGEPPQFFEIEPTRKRWFSAFQL